MNPYQATLSTVLDVLQEQKMDCLLVGGHVVNYYGYGRSTQDIDLMMVVSNPDAIVKAMKNVGFTSYSVSPLVLFFKKTELSIRVDFLRIDVQTFSLLMRSAATVEIMGCQVKIPSLSDLLAMKFFSYGQSPSCRIKDLQDIVSLSLENKIDAETVLKPLALKYASEEIYQQVYKILSLEEEDNHGNK